MPLAIKFPNEAPRRLFCPVVRSRLLWTAIASVAVKQTPLIAQYLSVKQRVPDALLFFRLGDFYEMFFEDAEVGARVLDIQLTSRNKDGVPLCGVPYHSAEPYIAKLLKAGHKVPEGGFGKCRAPCIRASIANAQLRDP